MPEIISCHDVNRFAMLLSSRESLATELLAFARRRNPMNKEELVALLEMARRAGAAEGYARAKLEMALATKQYAGAPRCAK